MNRLRDMFDLTLWAKLLARGMWGKALHFYGSVCVTSALLVLLSLRCVDVPNGFLPPNVPVTCAVTGLCFFLLISNYCFSKLAGSLLAIVVSVALPSALVAKYATVAQQMDLALLGKAHFVFIVIVVLLGIAYALAPLPYSVVGYKGWPHRRAMTVVLCAAGCLGLLLVTGVTKTERMSDNAAVNALFSLPSWSLAGAAWLWLTVGWLLSNYDAEILPPLLTRVGVPCQKQLGSEEAHLVDILVERIPMHPEL